MDLFAEEPRIPGGTHGGKRPGSGAKPKKVRDATTEDYEKYSKARAEKETWLAEQARLKFEVDSGLQIPREEVRQASATAYAAISQTLRSIPDNLERRLGLAPEVAEEVGRLIDESLAQLAEDLEKMREKDYSAA